MGDDKDAAAEIPAGGLARDHPIIAAAIEHFKPADLLYVDLEEWLDPDGKPARIYFRPFNMQDKAWLVAKTREVGEESFVDLILRKAVDQNESKLFSRGHRNEFLKRVSPALLMAVAGAITDSGGVNDYVKNLKAIPIGG